MAEMSIIGEINERSSYFREVTWKINKLFSFSPDQGYKIRSPPFHFAGVNGNLSVCPNGNESTPNDVIVSLFLRMVELKHESPPVTCEMGLLSKNSTLVKSNVSEKVLKNAIFMTCNFKKSDIQKNKYVFDPEETLTIYCKLTIAENARADEASQTERQVRITTGEWVFPETRNDILLSSPKEAYVQTDQRCMGVAKVLEDFKKLLDTEDDADVTMKVKDKEFKVHKGIVCNRTPVFAAMFKHDMEEKKTGSVSIDDCEPDIFKDFLHYVYTGIVDNLTCDNVFGLYEISDRYQVDDLKEMCISCLKDILSVDTFCEIISLALKYEEEELLKLATELFCDRMTEIIFTVKWQSFMCENPSCANELLIKRVQHESRRNV